MNIITSKTRRKQGREQRRSTSVSVSGLDFAKQKRGIKKENLNEYLHDKRIQELTREGYTPDAICGMMHGEKGSQQGELGNIKNIMKRTGGTIKLDGKI